MLFQAEARGKLLHGEDALTSRGIGVLSLVEPACLAAVLDELTGDPSGADAAELRFWPDYDGTEPDVVIRLPQRYVVLEAKNVSNALTSEQLVREWRMVSNRQSVPVQVVAITPDARKPTAVATAQSEVEEQGAAPDTIRW